MSSKLQHQIRKAQTRIINGAEEGKSIWVMLKVEPKIPMFVFYRALETLFDNGALSREQVPGWGEHNERDMQRQRRNYRIYRMGLDNTPPDEIAEAMQVEKTVVFGVLRTLKKHGLFDPCIETLGEEEEPEEDEEDGNLGDFPNPPGWWRDRPCHIILLHSYGKDLLR